MSDSQRAVLEQLGEWDAGGRTGVIGREIGDALGIFPQRVSYHIGKLEEKGLVDTPRDGRQKEIDLTDVGRLYLRWTGGVAG